MFSQFSSSLRVIAAAMLIWSGSVITSASETRLIMAEETGCVWCARWDREVAPEYPITAEGRSAPLSRINIHDPIPDDLELKTKIRFTPTFILVREGKEVSRLEGYPGEDFFWGLLQRMLREAGIDYEAAGQGT